jgi:putative transposase
VVLLFRSTESVHAENLFLHRQLALFMERGVRPGRVDAATGVSLAVLAKLFEWRGALVVVQPATMMRWHRAGWRLLWRLKSRRGRPPIPAELRRLIRRMARENPLWGEERIANELLLKLSIRISPRTVGKSLQKRPPGQPRGDQRWSTFLKNHATAILACDFFVAVTATFRMPDPPKESVQVLKSESRHRLAANALVLAKSVLGGLHHEYSLAAAPASA